MWGSFVNFLSYILSSLTNWTGNLGIAIILFTILVRVVLLPLTIKQLQSSKKMQELQPLMADLRRKYGKDQQKLTEEMTKLYREQKVNPAGSCLPLLVQLPIFLGVYQAVISLVEEGGLPENVLTFLGIHLGRVAYHEGEFAGLPYIVLPVLSVIFQFIVTLMATPKIQDPQQKAMTQALIFMPLIFGYIGFIFNQGAVLYWVTGSVLAAIQQFFVTGFGSLTNYLPFLPERKGFLTPSPAPAATTASDTEQESDEPKADFWTPLSKLRTTPATAGSDTATEQAISDAKRQINKKRR
jgi:YidC/Oxa1 family membrane protein insertase